MSTWLDLIEYSQGILLTMALWPKRDFSLIYKFRTYLTIITIFSLVVCLTYNAVFHSNDFIKLSESLYMLISVVNSFMKVVVLTVNGGAFWRLLVKLDADSFQRYNQLYEGLIQDFKGTMRKIVLWYRIIVNGTLIFMALFPVLESKTLPMDFPHFNNGSFHYPFYVFEIASVCVAAYGNVALDLLTVGVISIAAIQLKILNKKLIDTERNVRTLHGYSEDRVEELTLVYLNECCIHYSDIEELVKCVLEVISVIIFVQLGASVVAICNSGIMILTVDPLSMEAISLFLYIIAMFAQLGLYCWFGNFVYLESLEVTTSCYQSEWYQRGTAVRKTMFMLMERTKRPLQIRGINFVTLSFNTFIVILKWSYSYFTLLKNYTNNH